MLDFEEVLKELLGPEYGFRPEDIASKIGCSYKSVDRWRNGTKPAKPYRDLVLGLHRREKAKRDKKEAQ